MILIIGGDAKLSEYLISIFKLNNIKYLATSRRDNFKNDFVFLDFNQIDKFEVNPNIKKAIIVGGVTDYTLCEKNYEYAEHINCNQIPLLTKKLIVNDIDVYFISTNTVFTNDKFLPNEYDPHNPSFHYAKLKSKTEKKLHEIFSNKLQSNINIIRLTKNVNLYTEPFYSWIKDFKLNKKIYPFKDLYFAPILFSNSANAIYEIVTKNYKGTFHYSGEKDFSYDQFAYLLTKSLGFNSNLVSPISSTDKNVKLVYNDKITGLNMEMTSKITGLQPININTILNYFKQNYEKII